MTSAEMFLQSRQPRPLNTTISGLHPISLHLGQGASGLEVATFSSNSRPVAGRLQEAWRTRHGGRAVPLLIIVLHEGRAWLAGPSGDTLPVYADQDAGVIERICDAALRQPDRHGALRFLAQALPSLDTATPGLRNEGLFALHELTQDAPRRPDWSTHAAQSRGFVGLEGRDLLRRLGFAVERLDNMTQLLRAQDRRAALAVLLDQTDVPEAGSPRFGNLSPVSYALAKADAENLDWVVMVQGDRIRLYPTKAGVGVGRRGRTETYLELQTSVLGAAQLPLLSMIFSADALRAGGSVDRLLTDSRR